MSTTDPVRTRTTSEGTGGRGVVRTGYTGHAEETKPFWLTSEFLVLAASVAAVLIAAKIDDALDGPGAWRLVTILAAAYMIARGLAKSGSRHWGDDPRSHRD